MFAVMQEVGGETYVREKNLWVGCGALEAKKVVGAFMLALMMVLRYG